MLKRRKPLWVVLSFVSVSPAVFAAGQMSSLSNERIPARASVGCNSFSHPKTLIEPQAPTVLAPAPVPVNPTSTSATGETLSVINTGASLDANAMGGAAMDQTGAAELTRPIAN